MGKKRDHDEGDIALPDETTGSPSNGGATTTNFRNVSACNRCRNRKVSSTHFPSHLNAAEWNEVAEHSFESMKCSIHESMGTRFTQQQCMKVLLLCDIAKLTSRRIAATKNYPNAQTA